MFEQFGAPQAAMAGMYQTPAHQQFTQQYQASPYQGAPPRPAWASPGGWNQMQQAQQQPRQAPVAYARPMAQNAYGNQLAEQQPRQAYQQQAQRVQQNANAIQQAQARPLGAGAGVAAAAQGIRSPSAPGGQIGSAPKPTQGTQSIQSPTAPINQIQRNTMARI